MTTKYGDLSKACDDLFKLDKYQNTMTVKHTTASGLSLESVTTAKDTGFTGSYKFSGNQKDLGAFEFSGDTSSKFTTKFKPSGLPKGLKAAIKVVCGAKPLESNVNLDYSQKHMTGTFDVTFAGGKAAVKASATVGDEEGLTFGGIVSAKVGQGKDKMECTDQDYHVGFQVKEADFAFALNTAMVGKDNKLGLVASFHQQVGEGHERGLQFTNTADSNELRLATKYQIDGRSSLKTVISTNGTIDTALSHILTNPQAKLNIGTQYTTTNGYDIAAKKYGFGITLGEF